MRNILYSALAVLVLSSCNKNEETIVTGNYPADGVVRINTEVNAQNTMTTNEAYTGSNLSMTLLYDEIDTYNYSNIKWTTADGGATWTSATKMLWKSTTIPAKIYSYAPYVVATDVTSIPFNVASSQNQGLAPSDFLGYVNTGFVPGGGLTEKQSVKILFEHKLAKLTLNITSFGDELGSTPPIVSTVSLNNILQTVNYNAITGIVSPASGTKISIIMRKVSENCYEAIFPPQVIAAGVRMLTISIQNKDYYYTIPTGGLTFVSGAAYEMNLRVAKDIVNIGGVTVTDWNTGAAMSDGNTEEITTI